MIVIHLSFRQILNVEHFRCIFCFFNINFCNTWKYLPGFDLCESKECSVTPESSTSLFVQFSIEFRTKYLVKASFFWKCSIYSAKIFGSQQTKYRTILTTLYAYSWMHFRIYIWWPCNYTILFLNICSCLCVCVYFQRKAKLNF